MVHPVPLPVLPDPFVGHQPPQNATGDPVPVLPVQFLGPLGPLPVNNLLSICNFTSVAIHAMTFHNLVEAVRAVTGWDTSLYEIMLAVERSMVMSRMFNLREGFGPHNDKVIRRWHEPMPGGRSRARSSMSRNSGVQ